MLDDEHVIASHGGHACSASGLADALKAVENFGKGAKARWGITHQEMQGSGS